VGPKGQRADHNLGGSMKKTERRTYTNRSVINPGVLMGDCKGLAPAYNSTQSISKNYRSCSPLSLLPRDKTVNKRGKGGMRVSPFL